MKQVLALLTVLVGLQSVAQQDATLEYKKRVLESTEVDFLSSYYEQDGNNAAVTGGIGTEKLTDFTPTIVVNMPLNDDDILTIDAGISTYTSASSSNLNPFDRSGASGGDDDDDDDDDHDRIAAAGDVIGSPWVASSGASSQDTWGGLTINYAHSSDDRNHIWNASASFATEYDYTSIGFGGGYTKQFNDKNSELGLHLKVFLDTWNPEYPTELDSYIESNGNLNAGFFNGVDILDQNGAISNAWTPTPGFELIQNKGRNTYSASFSFSQIVSRNAQVSLFFDIVKQDGWLANPMQRVYFADRANYYIGNAASIHNYTSANNTDVFQLADDIERLPSTRLKIPIGMRFHYYVNQSLSLRTYYRYYTDDWGITSHTANVELPIKVSQTLTVYPSYRYYTQTEADYFAGFESHVSTETYYTSDFDLSKFNANQFGFGISYTDVFTKAHLWKFGLKSIDLKYNNYKRNTGLTADIVAIGFKFIMD